MHAVTFRQYLLLCYINHCLHLCILTVPVSEAQSKVTALRVVARPTTTSGPNPLISAVRRGDCPSVSQFGFARHRFTMISSSAPFLFNPPSEATERMWRTNSKVNWERGTEVTTLVERHKDIKSHF